MTGGVRRRWAAPAAAAAVLVVVAGAALARTSSGDDEPPDSSALTGTRVVSYRDVLLNVPADWGWGHAPGPDWCADVPGGDRRFPDSPFAQTQSRGFVMTIACPDDEKYVPAAFGDAPSRLWVPHVELVDADSDFVTQVPDGETTHEGWTLTARTVGAAQVRVLSDASTAGLVRPMLDSARVVDTTPEGCDVRSPAQATDHPRPPAFDLSELATVDRIAVCQYSRLPLDRAGLVAARSVDGAAAQSLLEAIKQAPAGGGPDTPANCAEDDFGDEVMVLRLAVPDAESHDVYVGYSTCRGNGFDDGTTVRKLTRDSCLPLWEEPVVLTGGQFEVFQLCKENMDK